MSFNFLGLKCLQIQVITRSDSPTRHSEAKAEESLQNPPFVIARECNDEAISKHHSRKPLRNEMFRFAQHDEKNTVITRSDSPTRHSEAKAEESLQTPCERRCFALLNMTRKTPSFHVTHSTNSLCSVIARSISDEAISLSPFVILRRQPKNLNKTLAKEDVSLCST